jgi:transmembrane sensor
MSKPIPAYLIVRYLSNEATDEEQEHLLEWVSSDIRNQKTFHEFSAAWEKRNSARPKFDLEKGRQILNNKIENAPVNSLSFPWFKMAAALLLLVLCSGAIILSLSRWNAAEPLLTEIKTRPGERANVVLPDGSAITLNENSSLRYPASFRKDNREIYMTGEVFFDVTKDQSRPFIIYTGALKTEVLGTSFNIKENNHKISVTVATGKVKVSVKSKTQLLLPNDEIVFNTQTQSIIRQQVDLEQTLAWVTNTVIFDNTSLIDASTILEKRFSVSVHFKNSAIQKCTITGKFKNETLEHILKAIAFSTGVQCSMNDKVVEFSGKGCH